MVSPQCTIHKLAADTISLIHEYPATPIINFDPKEDLSSHREQIWPKFHHLGYVCRRWDDISRLTPSVWRHITVFIDIPPTGRDLAASRLRTFLTRSTPLSVFVYLLRRTKTPQPLDCDERGSVEALMNILKGQWNRVEALVIETNQASSLPELQSLLVSSDAQPRRWRTLVLTSHMYDSILQHPRGALPLPMHGRFEARQMLTTVYIDGRNMLEMLRTSVYRGGTGAEDVFASMPMLETLVVNNLTVRVEGYSDELVQYFFLSLLPSFLRLTTLGLDAFEPPSQSSSSQPLGSKPPFLSTSIRRLIIKRANQHSIEFALKRITHPRDLVLIHCYFTTPSPIVHISHSSKLVLVDIPADAHRVLPKMINFWDGQHLELNNCPCIRSLEADRANEAQAFHAANPLPMLAHLISLKIIDCPNFRQDWLMSFQANHAACRLEVIDTSHTLGRSSRPEGHD